MFYMEHNKKMFNVTKLYLSNRSNFCLLKLNPFILWSLQLFEYMLLVILFLSIMIYLVPFINNRYFIVVMLYRVPDYIAAADQSYKWPRTRLMSIYGLTVMEHFFFQMLKTIKCQKRKINTMFQSTDHINDFGVRHLNMPTTYPVQ